jgi:hypothetical protein
MTVIWVPAPQLGGDNADAYRAQLDADHLAEAAPARHGAGWALLTPGGKVAYGHVGREVAADPLAAAREAAECHWHDRLLRANPESEHQRGQRYAALELLAMIRERVEEPDGNWPGGDLVQLLTEEWFPRHGVTVPDPNAEDEDPPAEDYDPGPECDDEGGMSEYRYLTAPDEP